MGGSGGSEGGCRGEGGSVGSGGGEGGEGDEGGEGGQTPHVAGHAVWIPAVSPQYRASCAHVAGASLRL